MSGTTIKEITAAGISVMVVGGGMFALVMQSNNANVAAIVTVLSTVIAFYFGRASNGLSIPNNGATTFSVENKSTNGYPPVLPPSGIVKP